MNVRETMNWILYGNRYGNITQVKDKTTQEYDDFIKSVFHKDEIEKSIEEGQKECFEVTGRDYEILDDELN